MLLLYKEQKMIYGGSTIQFHKNLGRVWFSNNSIQVKSNVPSGEKFKNIIKAEINGRYLDEVFSFNHLE